MVFLFPDEPHAFTLEEVISEHESRIKPPRVTQTVKNSNHYDAENYEIAEAPLLINVISEMPCYDAGIVSIVKCQ